MGTKRVSLAQIADIRKARADGLTYRAISERFGISDGTASDICNGRSGTGRHVRRFSEAEKATMRTLYRTHTIAQIAKTIGRSDESVRFVVRGRF